MRAGRSSQRVLRFIEEAEPAQRACWAGAGTGEPMKVATSGRR